VINPL